MKIRCLLVGLVLSTMLSVHAQDQDMMRHEIGVTYGISPNSAWIDALSNVFSSLFGQETVNDKYFGPMSVEYFYHTSDLVGVGAVAVMNTINEDNSRNDKLLNHYTKSYYTLMPAVKFNWLRKQNWGMYNKIALGATYAHGTSQPYNDKGQKSGEVETDNDILFNFQASLGVEAGKNHWWGFTEFGIGEQGVALLGVRYKF